MSSHDPSDSKFTRHYREEVTMVFSGIDCVLNGDSAIYCSSELTTGSRLYDCLRRSHLRTAAELKQKMGQEWYESHIFNANMRQAADFARSVRSHFDQKTLVVTPAPFVAPGWSQPEYLAFWETLIRTRIQGVWFNRNWQFSNGCTFELSVALDASIPIFDQFGTPLEREQTIHQIEDAIACLKNDHFDTSKLEEALSRIQSIHAAR